MSLKQKLFIQSQIFASSSLVSLRVPSKVPSNIDSFCLGTTSPINIKDFHAILWKPLGQVHLAFCFWRGNFQSKFFVKKEFWR
jgi:hypothetical protein